MIKNNRSTGNNSLALLEDRAVIEIHGPDCASFLQNLITTDITAIDQHHLLPGALLSAQGKILFDFLIGKKDHGFFIDMDHHLADAFVKKLHFYKLRADITIELCHPILVHIALTQDPKNKQETELWFIDKRFPAQNHSYFITRSYCRLDPSSAIPLYRKDWDRLRIRYAIAESSKDFALGDYFPHDLNYDQIHGLFFQKGCYLGQEIISRMHHKTTPRKRTILAKAATPLPISATVIQASGKIIGTLGTIIETESIAIVRIDKIKALISTQTPIMAGQTELTFSVPPYSSFQL